ncbi:MAG: hypothetical protein KME11_05335 [Timaviella obliquedivisa GSE-PSE-MK23-08B]|nr:hypothetical protein [Timaviella obliquedivisa GSE-PSE-MK23-08B]
MRGRSPLAFNDTRVFVPVIRSRTNILGSLELGHLCGRWRQLYQALYAYKGWRLRSPLIAIDDDEDISHISEAEFNNLCQTFKPI